MAAKRRGIGYIRVSRVNGRQGDSFIAPDVQRATIEATARAKGIRIVEWIEDLDQSGAKYQRPGFQRALELCEQPDGPRVIVVARLTRFARSVADTHKAMDRLDAAGAQLVAADVDVDTTTSTGKLMRTLLSALAEFELDIIREQWTAARASAVERGVYMSTTAPLGYRFDDDHRLVPGTDAEAIREVFRGRAAGLTWKALAEQYAETTGREISSGSLDRVVANRVYLGELPCGTVNEHSHEPLVTVDEFRAANARQVQRAPRSGESSALLGAATLRCGTCGRTMSYRGGEGGQYVCNRSTKGEPCSAPVLIHASKLDPYVEAALVERIGAVEAEGSVEGDDLAAAEQRLAEATFELRQYLDADLISVVGVDAFRSGAEQRQARVDAAQDEVDALRDSRDLDDRLVTVGGEWHDLGRDDQRRIAAAALATVTVHRASRGRWTPLDERVEIAFAGATSAADRVAA